MERDTYFKLTPRKQLKAAKGFKPVDFPKVGRRVKDSESPYKISSWQYKAWSAIRKFKKKYQEESVYLATDDGNITCIAIMAKTYIRLDDGTKTTPTILSPSHTKIDQTYRFIRSKKDLERTLTDIYAMYRIESNRAAMKKPAADAVPIVKCLIEYSNGEYRDIIGISRVFKFFHAMQDDNCRIHIVGE